MRRDAVEVGEAAHQVGHQRGALARRRAKAAAIALDAALGARSRRGRGAPRTSARSLSPRPGQADEVAARSPPGSAARSASACEVSSAGMMPSRRVTRRNARERLVVGRPPRSARGRCRAATRARGPGPGSRGRPRSSAPRGSGPRRPAGRADSDAVQHARRARRRSAARRGGRSRGPRPPASTPISSTSVVVDEGARRCRSRSSRRRRRRSRGRAGGPRARAAARAPRRR